MNRQPVLVGDLVTVRPTTADDYDALYGVASDPAIWDQHPAHDRWRRGHNREVKRLMIDHIRPHVATVEFHVGRDNRRSRTAVEALEAAGIPAGPINALDEVFSDPQVIARGMAIRPGGLPGLAGPIVIDGERMVAERGAPERP